MSCLDWAYSTFYRYVRCGTGPIGRLTQARLSVMLEKNLHARCAPYACFDLDPIAFALINNLVVEVNQGFDPGIFTHGVLYHQLIHLAAR